MHQTFKWKVFSYTIHVSRYSLILKFSLCNSLIKTTPPLISSYTRQADPDECKEKGRGEGWLGEGGGWFGFKQTDYVNTVNTKFGFLGSYLLRRPLYSLNQNLDRRCCLCVLLWVSKAWKYLIMLSLHSISEPFGHLHLRISKHNSKLFNTCIINCCMRINWSFGNRDELPVRVRTFVWN